MSTHRSGLIAGLVGAILALTACGASPTADTSAGGGAAPKVEKKAMEVYAKFNAMSGEERHKALVQAAEKEGELSIYTSNTDIDVLVEEFEDTYDIDVSVYRANSESVLQRVLQEQRAAFYGNDVFETNALELDIANNEGLLAPYKSKLRDKVRSQALGDNWTGSRFNVFTVSYNTKLVQESELPDSIAGFADPKWKGKLSVEVGDVDWFAAMHKHLVSQGMSEQEATDLFKRIAANAKTVKGHTVQAELIAAGQFAVGLSTYSHSVDELDKEGAPITWRPESREPVQPLVVRPNGIGLMRTAANPAAAMLFVDFELTKGQELFAKEYRIGSIPTANDPLKGRTTVPVPLDELMSNSQKWNDLHQKIIQQTGQ